MGDPKKHRRKYIRPQHPWKADRIQTETDLGSKYGLANRREIWKASSEIARYRANARGLMILSGEEAQQKKENLMGKLRKLGLLDSDTLDDVLKLTTQDLLERRLQTLVYRKGLANTMRQARQFVTHGHILVNGQVTDIPGYVVRRDLEDTIQLKDKIKKTLQKKKQKEEEGEAGEVEEEEKKQEKTKKKAEKTEKQETKEKAKKKQEKETEKEQKKQEKAEEAEEKKQEKTEKQEKETEKKEAKQEEEKQEKMEKAETKKEEEKTDQDKSESDDSEDNKQKKDKS